MLHNDHGIALEYKPPEQFQKAFDIVAVQPGGTLIHHIDIAFLMQFAGCFQTLYFTSGKSDGGLPQGHIANPTS